MQCMEVVGGNGNEERHLRRPGLDVTVRNQVDRQSAVGGGDLHFVSSCASGRITRVLFAEVVGMQEPRSQLLDNLRDLMKRYVNSIRQAKFIRDATDCLNQIAAEGAYASMVISSYFSSTKSYQMCNIGQTPPLIYRARTRSWQAIEAKRNGEAAAEAGEPGVVDKAEFQHCSTNLELGDMVLVFSNSWTERQDAAGQVLGLEGFRQYLNQIDWSDPQAAISSVEEQFPHQDGGGDSTLLLSQATATKVSWKNNLLAPLRLLFPVADKTRVS